MFSSVFAPSDRDLVHQRCRKQWCARGNKENTWAGLAAVSLGNVTGIITLGTGRPTELGRRCGIQNLVRTDGLAVMSLW